jgi:hypothetical protein
VRRPLRLLVPVLAWIFALSAVTACVDDDGDASEPLDPVERLVDIYSATIEAIADEAGPLPAEDDDPMTIYVTPRDDADISADVQVGVVSALEDWATVRFIDSLDEALDRDVEGHPVRGEGLLIGLGPVSDGTASASLTADRYESQDMTLVFDVEVARRAGEWSVAAPLSGVPVDAP